MPTDTMKPGGRDAPDMATAFSRAASDHAAALTHKVTRIGQDTALTLARATYSGAYFISYCVVFPIVLGTRALPRENATMRGIVDGGRAAMDALAARDQAAART